MIRKDSIIAILDIETGINNRLSQSFLNNNDKNKIINIAEEGKQKSIVISEKGIYLSPISSSTLSKRSTLGMELDS
mgnify:FL=1